MDFISQHKTIQFRLLNTTHNFIIFREEGRAEEEDREEEMYTPIYQHYNI